MFFQRSEPAEKLKHFVKEYWIAEDDDNVPALQKIIPDGYCEIIFHYGDPYRINLHGQWETQSQMLFAGQISNHFYLQNTGCSGIIGIKLRPAAFFRLFSTEMSQFTNRVVNLDSIIPGNFIAGAGSLTKKEFTPNERTEAAEEWLLNILQKHTVKNTVRVERAIDILFEQNGLSDIETIAQTINYTRRHLEREFKKMIGLSPKLFSRIVRFNYIFQLMKQGNASWISIALDSGHFDQSHFIKNFKEFTGEEPSQYGFNDNTLANFFLKR